MTEKRVYYIYDERAMLEVDAAMVLSCADTLAEAKKDIKELWDNKGVIYSYVYESEKQDDGSHLVVDERYEWSPWDEA